MRLLISLQIHGNQRPNGPSTMPDNNFSSELLSCFPQGLISFCISQAVFACKCQTTQLIYSYSLKKTWVLAQKLVSLGVSLNWGWQKVIRTSFSFHLSSLCSSVCFPDVIKRMPIILDWRPTMLGTPEEKVCFFPRGAFFSSGFIKSCRIGSLDWSNN